MIETSLILGTYNDTLTDLQTCLASILHQEMVFTEIIIPVVSDDRNKAVLYAWMKTVNEQAEQATVKIVEIQVQRHPGHSPEGSFFQINEGLKAVTKPWIRWFSGNDILYPRATIKQVTMLMASGKLVSYGGYTFPRMTGEPVESIKFHPYDRKLHQRGNFVNDVALWSADLLRFTPFRWEELGNYAFWDFWLRIYEELGDVFHYTPEVFWYYRQHKGAMHRKRLKNKDELARYTGEQRAAFLKLHPLP